MKCFTVHWFVYLQAEADLRQAQAEFDRQAEITKLLLEGITSTHVCMESETVIPPYQASAPLKTHVFPVYEVLLLLPKF